MDRRKSIKTLVIGGISISAIAEACKLHENSPVTPAEKDKDAIVAGLNRMKEELAYEKMIDAEPNFFTEDEITSITILGDIIIPRDEVSGSASDAKVPAFMEFIVKDMPEHQTPLRGGLRWLDLQCLNTYGKSFKDCGQAQQMEMVDKIAWPAKSKTGYAAGSCFFQPHAKSGRNRILYIRDRCERHWVYRQCSESMEWRSRRCTETIQPGLYR